MNPTIDVLLNRKSIRAFENCPIDPEIKAQILHATLRAPTAGNLMLYSTEQQKTREMTPRFDEKFILFENGYRQLAAAEFDEMFAERESRLPKGAAMEGIANVGQATYLRKFGSDFSVEMNRSAREWLKGWRLEER